VAGESRRVTLERWLGWGGMLAGTALCVVGIRRGLQEDLSLGMSPALWVDAVMILVALVTFLLGLRFVVQSILEERHSPSAFFTDVEEQRLLEEIERFEKQTSGELRIHLERKAGSDVMARATSVFEELGLTATRDRNAVLFFFAIDEHRFAVLGDKGIHERVGEGFWNQVVLAVQTRLSAGNPAEALLEGIRLAGTALAEHFPPRPDDVNELPNALSRGK